MKSLQESLFDKDLASKEFCMNDLYTFECWPATSLTDWRNAEKTFSICYGDSDGKNPKNNLLYKTMLTPPFKKITKGVEYDWDIKNNYFDSSEFDFDFNFYLITWFVMGCHDEKEIKSKLYDLLMKASKSDNNIKGDDSDWSIIDCAIDILHDPRRTNDIRMIVIKLYTNNPKNSSTIYMTLTKKID